MDTAGPANPFAVLGLPETMDLTDDQIERAALTLSARLHPDAAGGDPEAESRLAAVNDARTLLASAESRAILLLQLAGGPSASADRGLPDGFLAEMMDIREQIEQAAQSKDAPALAQWRAWALTRRAQHASHTKDLFAQPPTSATLTRIRRELNAWRYIERLLEQISL